MRTEVKPAAKKVIKWNVRTAVFKTVLASIVSMKAEYTVGKNLTFSAI